MLTTTQLLKLNWLKTNDLIPVIVQNYISGEVLMHGYMNKEALNQTIINNKVTFYSRTKKRLWTKGELSNNFLNVVNIIPDCDNDTILILAKTIGPICHTGESGCFSNSLIPNYLFLFYLEEFIKKIKNELQVNHDSYTRNLFLKGGNKRIAQKVGEEGLETALAAMTDSNQELINEASDLIFHLLILLQNKNLSFQDIIINLRNRHNVSINN